MKEVTGTLLGIGLTLILTIIWALIFQGFWQFYFSHNFGAAIGAIILDIFIFWIGMQLIESIYSKFISY